MSGLILGPASLYWPTVGDAAWTGYGTTSRTPAAAVVDGAAIDLIGDADAGAYASFHRHFSYAVNGTKAVSFLIKRSSAYAYHDVRLYDTIATTMRLAIDIDFSAPTPVAAIAGGFGTDLVVTAVAGGWRASARSLTTVAANDHTFTVHPAGNAPADTAALYIGGIQLWDGPDAAVFEVERFGEGPPVQVGESSRAFAGTARSSVRASKRTWQGGTALYGKNIYDALLLACANEQPCHVSGDCIPGAGVTAIVRPTYELVTVGPMLDGYNFRWKIALALEEV